MTQSAKFTVIFAVLICQINFGIPQNPEPPKVIRQPNRCVAYGDCGKNPFKPQATTNIPCYYNGPPKPLDPQSFQILKDACPDLARDYTNEEAPVCCDAYQIKTVAQSLGVAAQIFARCPGCWYNYKQIFCSVICGPNQSLYVNNEVYVPNQNPNNPDENAIGVTSQGLYIRELIAEQWYRSCEQVIFGPTNGYAVEVTCNPPAGTSCTPYEWLRYPGENILAPIDLHYRLIGEVGSNSTIYTTGSLTYEDFKNEPETAEENMLPYALNDTNFIFDQQIEENKPPFIWADEKGREIPINTECYKPVPWTNSNETCSCTDCKGQDFCVSLTIVDIETGLNFLMFVAFGVFGLFIIFFVGYEVYMQFKRRDSDELGSTKSTKTKGPPTFLEKVHTTLFEKIGNAFKFWAEKVVCKYPLQTLAVTLIWLIILAAGFPSTEFTTDPIALWIDPASQNFEELEFYNQKFDPFYRSEIVIAALKEEYRNDNLGYDVELCRGENFEGWSRECLSEGLRGRSSTKRELTQPSP